MQNKTIYRRNLQMTSLMALFLLPLVIALLVSMKPEAALTAETQPIETTVKVVETTSNISLDTNVSASAESYAIVSTETTLPASIETVTIASNETIASTETAASIQEATVKPVATLPKGFVDVSERVPHLKIDLRYLGSHNFVGVPIDGYKAERAILTEAAADALKEVAEALVEQGFGLLFFDGYRPTQAVAHFVRWAEDEKNLVTKAEYYPDLNKSVLISSGYIARRSAHSRGSTVDLTLYRLDTGEALDMGSPFDFFGDISHLDTKLIDETQQANRILLKTAMEDAGFRAYQNEWWHFQLKNEPYPQQSFNFLIE